LLIVMLVGLSARAYAEDADDDETNPDVKVAEANVLFQDGKRLMVEGETAKACRKFVASYKLLPREGVHLNLAQCWDKLGKTASAWAIYAEILKTTKDADRRIEAKKRVKELEAELVRLTIEVPESSEIEGLEITRNDVVVGSEDWNKPLPVDPDDYTITARAKGREEWSKRVTMKSKDKIVEVPKLEKTKVEPIETPVDGNPYRKLSIGLVAGGGTAIVIGTVFGVRSRQLQNQADQLCPMQRCPLQTGVDRNQQARKEGWIANVSWGLGAAAVVTGVVAWRLGAKQKRDSAISFAPVVGEQTGVALGGRF
jgi:hypothetical protein